MAERTPLDMIHDGVAVVTAKANHLRDIAHALGRVGLVDLADEIETIAVHLHDAAKDVRRGHGREINGRVRQSEEATGNMIATALAMTQPNKSE